MSLQAVRCPLQEGLPARADLAAHKGDPVESPKIGVAVRREAVHPVRDPYVALSLQKEGSRGVPEGQNIWKVTRDPPIFIFLFLA